MYQWRSACLLLWINFLFLSAAIKYLFPCSRLSGSELLSVCLCSLKLLHHDVVSGVSLLEQVVASTPKMILANVWVAAGWGWAFPCYSDHESLSMWNSPVNLVENRKSLLSCSFQTGSHCELYLLHLGNECVPSVLILTIPTWLESVILWSHSDFASFVTDALTK